MVGNNTQSFLKGQHPLTQPGVNVAYCYSHITAEQYGLSLSQGPGPKIAITAMVTDESVIKHILDK